MCNASRLPRRPDDAQHPLLAGELAEPRDPGHAKRFRKLQDRRYFFIAMRV
jgi:hypothetical protein